ncbi:phosphatidylglycerophosphatase A [Roseomonas sp. GC11]|uniref:phosphatidylglycerophosphatase A family protein n=1 Tax=Roseomonas sp. GC11 TaxID=2950546 RepID=UPI002109AA31|nr:phosphatidylglycerophosphatase A [Roseomonas sp. GC11]MCQ4158982.1 phosphatidylglycerophosphatase A [Roseomonas sp. GC11]
MPDGAAMGGEGTARRGGALPRMLASLGGVGFLRPAPGSWGSAVVLPAALLGPWACLALAGLCAALGWWALARLPEAREDPSWVVIDEGAGQSLALAALGSGLATGVPSGFGAAPGIALAFLLFRLFDITKPGPVGWADRQKGASGVMLDDIIAGALAALVILALRLGGMLP